ncbi:hypothetical protein [Methanobrevibacter sp.]|uniref:hypothetical protein n=1 Tax=Methanobrevibacter sp. TaxID=66852 RepID=UPI00388FFA8E
MFEVNVFNENIQNQRKRRKKIREGHLISNETEKLGTIHFPKKIGDWIEERKRIKYAKRKAGII